VSFGIIGALRLWPQYPEANFNYAIFLETLNDRAGALMHHEQAIKQRADYIDARLRFANLLAEVGKGGRAAVSGSAAASAWLRRGSQQLRRFP
jgi:hypothetical protein